MYPTHTQPSFDLKRFAILCVDDEEMSLKYFARAYASKFRILTATNAKDGLQIFEQNKDEIGLLMTDQRMPGENGVWLLEKVREMRPRVVRVLSTAYSDMDAAIAAVNSGAIYKYVSKPWDPPQLETTLTRGLELFMLLKERDELLREKVSVLHNMMMADRIVSLGLLAAGMSHHIRNSLVAVKTFLDLAPEQLKQENVDIGALKNPEFWKGYHQNVQGQIKKINNLLNDLWSVSEKRVLHFADKVSLRSVIDAAAAKFDPVFAERKLQFKNDVPDSLPGMTVDGPQFNRLFDLLFKDETASLPAGSQITVSAEVSFSGTPPRGEVHIQVRDNGPGLTQESLRVLFNPFTPRNDSPAEYGINLMACYFIVHHHGGKIEAASDEGVGTVFHIRMPTDPSTMPLAEESQDFLQKFLSNDMALEKMLTAQ
jgi:two-component system probable response regulator PhcQ